MPMLKAKEKDQLMVFLIVAVGCGHTLPRFGDVCPGGPGGSLDEGSGFLLRQRSSIQLDIRSHRPGQLILL